MIFFGKTNNEKEINTKLLSPYFSIIEKLINYFEKFYFLDIKSVFPYFEYPKKDYNYTERDLISVLKFLELLKAPDFGYVSDDDLIIVNFGNKSTGDLYQFVIFRDTLETRENYFNNTSSFIIPAPPPMRSSSKTYEIKISRPEKGEFIPKLIYQKYTPKNLPFLSIWLYGIFYEPAKIPIEQLEQNPPQEFFYKYEEIIKGKTFVVPKIRVLVFDTFTEYPLVLNLPKREHFDVGIFNGHFRMTKNTSIWEVLDIKFGRFDISNSTPIIEISLKSGTYVYTYGYKPYSNKDIPMNPQLITLY